MSKNGSKGVAINFPAVVRGTVAALVISILGAAVSGLIFYFAELSERSLPLAGMGILFLSVFCGGLLASYVAGFKGIFHGVAVAVAFWGVSWLLATLFFPQGATFLVAFKKLAVAAVAGMLGGILGVGLSS